MARLWQVLLVRDRSIRALLVVSLVAALGACAGDDASPAGTATGPTGTAPAPTPVAPKHGRRYWAVYLAVGETDAPEVAAALDEIEAAGWQGGFTSIGCDQGADRVVGGDEDLALVGVYFTSEADALAFLATQREDAQGPVRVRTFCLD